MGDRFRAQGCFEDGAQYIGGRLRPAASGRTQDIVNPVTGERVHTCQRAGAADKDGHRTIFGNR
jgi:betaine-aldehyde dehydrogenase